MTSILLAFVLTMILPLGHQQEPALRDRLGAKLEITTVLREQRTCLSNPDSARTDLVLTIRFTNQGDYPIILDRYSGIVVRHSISHTQNDALARNYEYDARLMVSPLISPLSGGDFPPEGDSPSDLYLIIKPGEAHETASNVRLFLDYPDEYQHYSAAQHFLRLTVWTQSGLLNRDNNPEELRTRWLRHGYLWNEGGTSLPMPISF